MTTRQRRIIGGVSMGVVSIVWWHAFAQVSDAVRADVTAQNVVAAQETYTKSTTHYRSAVTAMMHAPSRQAIGRYIEQATLILQKKSSLLAAWAASRHVARDQDHARMLFLADIDALFTRSVAARRALDDRATDSAVLATSLAALRDIRADYDAVARRTMLRVWQERVVRVSADLDDLVAAVRVRDIAGKDALLERIAAQRKELEALRAHISAVPTDAAADRDNAQFNAAVRALRAAQASDGTWAQLQSLLDAVTAALTAQ